MPAVENTTSEKQIQRAKRKTRNAREQYLSDLRVILATPGGLRFAWAHLGDLGFNRLSWEPGMTDHQVYFHEGQRSAANRFLLDMDEADPTAYHRMVTFAFEQKQNDKREQDALNHTKEGNDGRRAESESDE